MLLTVFIDQFTQMHLLLFKVKFERHFYLNAIDNCFPFPSNVSMVMI